MRFSTLPILSLIAVMASAEQVPLQPSESLVNPTGPSLADLLTIEGSASIFYSYARETLLSARFADLAQNTTLLVPTNKAVIALPRKPHQDPVQEGVIKEGDVVAMDEQAFDEMSKRNVERWVSAHIIPKSPIRLSGSHGTMLEGKQISFDAKSCRHAAEVDWERVKVDGEVKIIGKKEAANGVLYLLDGTIKLD